MKDVPVPHTFRVQAFGKLGTCAITTDGDWTLLCLACGRVKKTVGSCTTPFVLHYPSPEYCGCDGVQVNAHECMNDVQDLRAHLMTVNVYFNTMRPTTPEAEHARDAVLACWEDIIRLAIHLGGSE